MLQHRTARSSLHPDLEQGACDISGSPEFVECWGHHRLCQMYQTAKKFLAVISESHLDSTLGSEQIGNQRELGSDRIPKQDGGTATGNHSPMDFRNLEPRIDRSIHFHQIS